MNEYWYLCGDTGVIKYAGQFMDFDDCDMYLSSIKAYSIWIFTGTPKIEDKHEHI